MNRTDHIAPHYVVFSTPLSPRCSYAQIPSSAPYVPPSMWQTKFDTNTKQAKFSYFWRANWKTKDSAPNDCKDFLTSISVKFAPTYQTKRNNTQKLTIAMKIHWPVNFKTFTEGLQCTNLVIDAIFIDSKIHVCRSWSNRMTRVFILTNFGCNVDTVFSSSFQRVLRAYNNRRTVC